MKKCEIFFSENDELAEQDIQEKGWRGDIIVKIGEDLFKPSVMTPMRLFAQFNHFVKIGQVYDIDQNLILVEQTDRNTIINVLVRLMEIGYFSRLKPIDLKKEYASCFQELQDLKNWVKVH